MWPLEHDPANPDALPDYDGLGWDSQWTAADWMTWHGALAQRYGQAQANARFVDAWNGGGFFGSPPLSARSFDGAFRDFARANGLLDSLYTGLGVIAKPLGVANDLLDGASAVGGGVKDAGKSIGSTLKWWLLAAGAILFVVYFLPAGLVRKAVAR